MQLAHKFLLTIFRGPCPGVTDALVGEWGSKSKQCRGQELLLTLILDQHEGNLTESPLP